MLNTKEATERFRKKLDSGYFKQRRSTNDEVDYAKEKEDRDTAAVKEFAESDLFQVLLSRA